MIDAKDSSLLSYLVAKFLAISEPIEKPTKCILWNFNSSIKFSNCDEKSSKLIFDFVNGVFPWPKISYTKTVLLNELICGSQILWLSPTPWINTIGISSFLFRM